MHTLAESLSEYGEVMLAAIAGQWQVEPGQDHSGLPQRLAAAMLEPARLQAFVMALDAPARAALAQVVAAGGSIRGHLLTRAHGELRRLGPRAMEREAPWRQPASALERLYYAGLLFRRYARLGSYHGEVYYIPSDLLPSLPPLRTAELTVNVTPVPAPPQPRDQGDSLALDLELLIARLRLQPAPAVRDGALATSYLAALKPRWWGEHDPERLALLLRTGQRARLIARRGDVWQVGTAARTWLEQESYRRQQALFDAWQGDSAWNELWRIPHLRCEETGWRNDPLSARQAVLALLRRLPAGWVRLVDLVAAIKAAQPDFARPDGDYDSWYIRDRTTGQYLSGFAHWEAIEGSLIRHVVTRMLYWLGAVALDPEGEHFALTRTGRAFLRLTAPPPDQPPLPLEVREDLTLVAHRRMAALDRARLERFARWQGREGEADRYMLEAEAMWRAYNAGLTPVQVAAFLQRASGGRVPAAVQRILRGWQQRFGRVVLQRAVLLQTVDAETLRQLGKDAELAQRLGTVVSDRAVLVPEGQVEPVLARLTALGWWPRLNGLSAPEGPGRPESSS
ncbi:MAG: helicase-associated domain-containing protein [Anaerolineae bacterium]